MKSTKRWFELAEYTSLGFSALGTIAAAATQQTLYAATPLTITLSLNLLNRQELARRTRQIGNNVTQLEQQVPSNIRSLYALTEQFNNRQEPEKIGKIHQDLIEITEGLEELKVQSSKFATSKTINQLQKQIEFLYTQFNNRLELREIEILQDKINSLVTYEEIEKIRERLTRLDTVQKGFATTEALEQFQECLNKFVTTEKVTEIQAQLTEQLNVLKLHLDNLSAFPKPIDLTDEIEIAIAAIQSQLSTLKPIPEQIVQLQSKLSLLEDLDASAADLHDYTLHLKRELENQKTQLNNQTQQLLIVPQQLKALEVVTTQLQEGTRGLDLRTNEIENQLKELNNLANQFVKAEDLKKELTQFSEQFPGQIDVNIEEQIQTFNQLVKETRPAYEYELVFDRKGSREVLLEALKTAKKRLILVCPWITNYAINDEVHRLFENFLRKKGIIEIGWGHLKDINEGNLENGFLYNGLDNLRQLRDKYPNQLKLKVLGTHEKFLICDDSFAMLGSHNFLTSDDRKLERELGLITNDIYIIKKLIERFENAPNLNAENDESDDYDNFEENSYDDFYYKPMTQEEYYGYDVGFENSIDRAERLYGIPDPRLVEDD